MKRNYEDEDTRAQVYRAIEELRRAHEDARRRMRIEQRPGVAKDAFDPTCLDAAIAALPQMCMGCLEVLGPGGKAAHDCKGPPNMRGRR